VTKGLAYIAGGKVPAGVHQVLTPAMQPFHDRTALRGAHRLTQYGPCPLPAQVGFDPIEMLELAQDERARGLRLIEGVAKRPALVSHASAQQDDAIRALFALPHKSGIAGIPVGLHNAPPVVGNDAFQALRPATRMPCKEGISARPVNRPQIAGLCGSIAGTQIFDRRLPAILKLARPAVSLRSARPPAHNARRARWF